MTVPCIHYKLKEEPVHQKKRVENEDPQRCWEEQEKPSGPRRKKKETKAKERLTTKKKEGEKKGREKFRQNVFGGVKITPRRREKKVTGGKPIRNGGIFLGSKKKR